MSYSSSLIRKGKTQLDILNISKINSRINQISRRKQVLKKILENN